MDTNSTGPHPNCGRHLAFEAVVKLWKEETQVQALRDLAASLASKSELIGRTAETLLAEALKAERKASRPSSKR